LENLNTALFSWLPLELS